MQTRSGKRYDNDDDIIEFEKINNIQKRINQLNEKIKNDIERNLKNGIYGQTPYIDDYIEKNALIQEKTILLNRLHVSYK
jgi:hypothetical protein